MEFFNRLFGLKTRVDRRTYAVTGVSLMLFKYLVDALVIWKVAGVEWTPLDYLTASPLRSVVLTGGAGSKISVFPVRLDVWLLVWTLVFIWIGVGMTFRRAVDAGKSPWLSLWFFVPWFNYAMMLFLALAPSVPHREVSAEAEPESYHVMRSSMIGVAAAIVFALGMLAISVFGFASYDTPLFVGLPVVFGAAIGYGFNRDAVRKSRTTNEAVIFGLGILGGLIVLFAMEGVLCLVMALPIAIPLALLGGYVGRQIAIVNRSSIGGAMAGLLMVPAGIVVNKIEAPAAPAYELVTAIDIAAPPAVVWKNVIGFREINQPLSWYFRAGIAYPIRATIAGEGVGAIRRCVFSTGAFVEPITVWDPPRTLAFGVTEQPAPLQEWSPYAHVYAPHLKGFFVSERGEFRLIPLANGGTRLEGHTWYHNAMAPQAYWRLFSDPVLHRIHARVLEQVKRQSEYSAQ